MRKPCIEKGPEYGRDILSGRLLKLLSVLQPLIDVSDVSGEAERRERCFHQRTAQKAGSTQSGRVLGGGCCIFRNLRDHLHGSFGRKGSSGWVLEGRIQGG